MSQGASRAQLQWLPGASVLCFGELDLFMSHSSSLLPELLQLHPKLVLTASPRLCLQERSWGQTLLRGASLLLSTAWDWFL